jgi:hypothetical protein
MIKGLQVFCNDGEGLFLQLNDARRTLEQATITLDIHVLINYLFIYLFIYLPVYIFIYIIDWFGNNPPNVDSFFASKEKGWV